VTYNKKDLEEHKEKVDEVIRLILEQDVLREVCLRSSDPDLYCILFDIIEFMIKINQVPDFLTDILQLSYRSKLIINVIENTSRIKQSIIAFILYIAVYATPEVNI